MYFKVVLYMVIAFVLIGMLGPFLISSTSTVDVGFGILLGILFLPFSFWYSKWSFKC